MSSIQVSVSRVKRQCRCWPSEDFELARREQVEPDYVHFQTHVVSVLPFPLVGLLEFPS